MGADKAYATFLYVNGERSEEYRIRFNKVAARSFKDVSQVKIFKTDKYVILVPSDDGFGLKVCKYENGTGISLTRLVKQDGFMAKEWFDGTHYAVKRGKPSGGRVYICLEKVVDIND